jgi:hypothetical protein
MISQHSLPGGRYPLPGPDFHRLDRASFAWRTQTELDAFAIRLNSRPRRTLGFATPDEVFSRLVDKDAHAVTARNAEGVRYEI